MIIPQRILSAFFGTIMIIDNAIANVLDLTVFTVGSSRRLR